MPTSRTTTRWVLALTGVGSLMAALDTLVVASALTTLRADLDASVSALEWTVNAYNLTFAVLLITASALATGWAVDASTQRGSWSSLPRPPDALWHPTSRR